MIDEKCTFNYDDETKKLLEELKPFLKEEIDEHALYKRLRTAIKRSFIVGKYI
jgi:hypothetical protein